MITNLETAKTLNRDDKAVKKKMESLTRTNDFNKTRKWKYAKNINFIKSENTLCRKKIF